MIELSARFSRPNSLPEPLMRQPVCSNHLPRPIIRPRRASQRTSRQASLAFSWASVSSAPSATITRSPAGNESNSGASPPSSRTCRRRVLKTRLLSLDDLMPSARRELTIPGTKKVVAASHLDGSTPAWRPRADTREILAEWVTAPDNPYFARAVVNRVWARFFGVGLIEPVDNLDGDGGSELSGLLDELAGQFRAHGYNLKFLIRVLTATRAYNLSSAEIQGGSTTSVFASMPVRGLSAEQLFDSLTQATGSEAADARARFLELFANREERSVEAETTIVQALTMMNGSYIEGATNPETSQVLGAIVKAPFLDIPGRIETLFLATLTRRPRPDELSLLVRYIERRKSEHDHEKAIADIFWAILNGPEFHLNH